jgi:hypothetical protein
LLIRRSGMNEEMQPTKLLILADDAGKILAAYVSGLREGNVPHVSIVPQAGQVVREVQVPEELARLDFGPDTFSKYRLRVTGAEAALVKHNK